MGADLIGWRGCPLQEQLAEQGFLGKLKLRAYRAAIEEQVPEDERAKVEVVVRVTGRPDRSLRYADICTEVATFEQGIPDCAACPLSGGHPVGCYRYVSYPIDAVAERLIFEFFAADVQTQDSICDQIWRDIASRVDEDSPWYSERGEEGNTLAVLAQPLALTFSDAEGKPRSVDSAQVLAALFISLPLRPVVIAYARFWSELFAFVGRRLRDAGAGIGAGGDVEIHGDDPRARHGR